ncbi:MAG: response regulator [Eubacteriales bacterium]|jgi:two-component system OmpR family response regulator
MKKVLIVDDTKNIRLLLTKCLELEGYSVVTATNGREGLEQLLQTPFDLAFLDIKLPEISGTEVLRRARAAGIMTPVIIITAYPTVKNAVECTQLGAITYLQKPFTADRLKVVLSQLNLTTETPAPDTTYALLDAVQQQLKQGRPQAALDQLQELLAKSPTNGKIYALMAQAYRALGDEENANRMLAASEIFLH